MITTEFGAGKDLRFNLQTGATTFKGSRLLILDANDGAVFEIRNKFRLANSQPKGEIMKVHEIPGTVVVEWNDDVKAIVDTWTNYTITAPQFREAILEKGIAHARAHRGRAWVMDATKAKGAFPDEVQKLIETEIFKAFAAIRIKYFITIKSAASTITNMSIKSFTANMGPCGIQMVEVPDLNKAIAWLKEHP